MFGCCSAPLLPLAAIEGVVVEEGAIARARSDGEVLLEKATMVTRSLSKKCLAEEQPETSKDDSPKRHKSAELSKADSHVGLRVRTAAGSVVLSLPASDCAGMPVRQLRERIREVVGRTRELKIFLGTRELVDSESLTDPGADGVQELLLVTSSVPALDPDRPVLEQLDVLKGMIMSSAPHAQLDGCTHMRKLLGVEDNPPIQAFVELGVVPRLLQLGEGLDGATPQVQFEALWAVTNIASGTSEQTQAVADAGALEVVVRVLNEPPDDTVWEQAAWIVGNIAGDSPRFRDLAHEAGTMQPILEKLERDRAVRAAGAADAAPLSLVRQATWALSNLCRGKPSPSLAAIVPALPVLAGQLLVEDDEVKTDAAWAVSYISDGENERIGAVIEAGMVPRLVELLREDALKIPALRAVGNLATGDDIQTQAVLDAGALPALVELLDDDRRSTRKEACWSLSNILAGTREQIGEVLGAGALPRLIELLSEAHDVKREAAWCISNAGAGGSPDHVRQLVAAGCIEEMAELVNEADTRLRRITMEFLEGVCKVEDPSAKPHADAEGLYEGRVRDVLARDALRVIAEEDEDAVCSGRALSMMERLYPDPFEEEE